MWETNKIFVRKYKVLKFGSGKMSPLLRKNKNKQTPDDLGKITYCKDWYEDNKPIVPLTMAHTIISSFKSILSCVMQAQTRKANRLQNMDDTLIQ